MMLRYLLAIPFLIWTSFGQAPAIPFLYTLKIEGGASVIAFPNAVVKDFLTNNKFLLKLTGAQVPTSSLGPLKFSELANNLGGAENFEKIALLMKEPAKPPTLEEIKNSPGMQRFQKQIEEAERLRQEAFDNSDPEDPEFDTKFESLRRKYGLPSQFVFTDPDPKTRFANARAALDGYINTLDALYASSLAQGALPDVDPQPRCLDLANTAKIPGILVTKISKPVPASGKEDFTSQYLTESHYRWQSQNFFSHQKRTAVAVAANGGGDAGVAVLGASVGFEGRWNYGTELDQGELFQHDVTSAYITKTRVSQILSFDVTEMKFDRIAMDGLKQIEIALKNNDEGKANQLAEKWFDQYPSEVLVGPYGVGSSFQMRFSTTAASEVQGTQIIDIGLDTSETRFSLGISVGSESGAGGLGIGVGQSEAGAYAINDQKREEEISVRTQWHTVFIGPKVTDFNAVEAALAANPEVWNLIPAVGSGTYEYQDIFSILRLGNPGEIDIGLIEGTMRRALKLRDESAAREVREAKQRLADKAAREKKEREEFEKHQEYLRIPIWRNHWNECHNNCPNKGKCLYCGREGICCRQHWYNHGCGRNSGCHLKHCCAPREGEGRRFIEDVVEPARQVSFEGSTASRMSMDDAVGTSEVQELNVDQEVLDKMAKELAGKFYTMPKNDEFYEGPDKETPPKEHGEQRSVFSHQVDPTMVGGLAVVSLIVAAGTVYRLREKNSVPEFEPLMG